MLRLGLTKSPPGTKNFHAMCGMTFYEFSHDVVPVFQFCLTVIGLTSLFLIWWQARRTTRWNQVVSHHQFFKDTPSHSHERAAHDAAKKIQVDLEVPLDAQSAQKFFGDDDARFAARNLLNDYEELCSAIQVGTLSESYAYSVDATRVIRAYKTFKSFIELMRAKKEAQHAWTDLQKLALKWEVRQLALRQKKEKAFAKLEKDLAKLEQKIAAKRVAR
jgi:hypothetical protein